MADDTMHIKAWDGSVALAGTDRDLVVIFHKDTKINPIKSRDQGVPIYDQVDFLKVIHPGEPLNVYDQPVREQDKYRFKDQWERYQKGTSQEVSGTPLSVLFPMNPEIVRSFAAIHVTTVQQLAGMSDTAKQNVMFGMNLSEKAKQYLSIADKGAEFHAMQAKMDDMAHQLREANDKIAALSVKPAAEPKNDGLAAQVAALTELVNKQLAPPEPPKRRGRPPGSKRKPPLESVEQVSAA